MHHTMFVYWCIGVLLYKCISVLVDQTIRALDTEYWTHSHPQSICSYAHMLDAISSGNSRVVPHARQLTLTFVISFGEFIHTRLG